MSTAGLIDMNLDDLQENYRRLLRAASELQFCLIDVEEEYDELQSTNTMFKSTIDTLKRRNSISQRLFSLLKRPSLTPRGSTASLQTEAPSPTLDGMCEEVSLPKYYRKPKQEVPKFVQYRQRQPRNIRVRTRLVFS